MQDTLLFVIGVLVIGGVVALILTPVVVLAALHKRARRRKRHRRTQQQASHQPVFPGITPYGGLDPVRLSGAGTDPDAPVGPPIPPSSQPPVPAAPDRSAVPRDMPYIRTPALMTRAELAFFRTLQTAVPPRYVIVPQMRLANLMHVQPHVHTTKKGKYAFYRIQAKCVDFVLCDAQTYAPALVIELDDRSHDRPDRQARDQFVDAALAAIDLPILHVRWQPTYDTAELAHQVCKQLGVPAPAVVPARPVS
jgi:hypothetical protein